MRRRKKKSIKDLLAGKTGKPISGKEIYTDKFRSSLHGARGSDTDDDLIEKFGLNVGKYSMRTRIKNNPWVKQGRPASSALKWLYREVFKDASTYRYNKLLMAQGGMYIFQYQNPKYKDTSVLPYFDRYPLVIALGPVATNLGIRNMGFNLHLLPPKIRIIVMCSIFELHKRLYRYNIFYDKNNPVKINYQYIIKNLTKYGVKFCIRMYIPQRQKQIVNFPFRDWHKAIFVPSRGYYGIRAAVLIKEWRHFCKKNGHTISPNVDWKSII